MPSKHSQRNVKAVVVCGSREGASPADLEWLRRVLIDADIVIHGGCQGVDTQADEVATSLGIPTIPMTADWRRHGKAAGPVRNKDMARMLQLLREYGHDVSVAALPGGRGTENMKTVARRLGLAVFERKPPTSQENHESRRT